MAEKLKLFTLLQDKPWNVSLKSGKISSPLFEYNFDNVKEASDHFKPMARDQFYDTGELAIVTYLQALEYKKPLVLIPFVVSGAFHHKSIAYNAGKGEWLPKDLPGKKVGVRSYAQTTGVWVRGVLQNEYGADLDKTTFITFQDGHLAEYTDPPNCVRAPAGKKLINMLLEGEVDAGMLGSNMPDDPRIKTLIPNAAEAAKEWHKKTGITPINHMYVVKKSLVEQRPDVVKEVHRTLAEARDTGPGAGTYGHNVEALRETLDLVIHYAYQQKVISKKFKVDELFDDFTRTLGK